VQSGAAALVSPVTVYGPSVSTPAVRGRILRGLGWFLVVVLVIGAGVAGGAYLYDQHTLQELNNSTGSGGKAGKKADRNLDPIKSVNSPAIALVAGYDVRAGTGASSYAGSNSDTLMLLRADPTTDTLSVLSFPRDLNVPIYCSGDTVSTNDRINAAWADCGADGGPQAAVLTMEHLTGLKINYLITLDFNAFKRIVDKLHGVYLNVDRRYYNPPNTGYSAINLEPGYQKLNGGQALAYVRFRHLDSDIYRNGRQQLFLEALKQRVKTELSLSNFLLLPRLVGALHGNLAVGKAGGGNLTNGEIESYLGLIRNLPPGHQIRNAIPPQELSNITVGTASELSASPEAIAAAVSRFMHPAVAAAPHKGGKKTPKLPHKTISVLVLNAGNITGGAENTSYLLGKHGFVTKTLPGTTPANAPSLTYYTVVYYDPSQATGQKAAEELAPLFGAHTSVAPMTPAIATIAHKAGDPLTVAAIGTAFNGTLKFPRIVKPPSTSAKTAQVQDGLPVALSAVRAANGPAHFTLMVPHKVAAGSSLSTDNGARLFRPLHGKQEFVLTFFLPNGIEYWQVEESNWTTEPLLANPTAHFTHKGREYEEFTSGGKIQQIAVHFGHSVYWVQNTILNTLSNATMIAIAEGLQPIH
jgi:LCP family protein required for cell wall assembly